jgi:hypothetical protein
MCMVTSWQRGVPGNDGSGGGISASIGDGAANTTLSFVNVTATSNTADGRSGTGINCIGCVVALFASSQQYALRCVW